MATSKTKIDLSREPLPDLVPIARAMAFLGVSESTIYRRIRTGALTAVDIGAPDALQPTLRIPREELEAVAKPVDPNSRKGVSDIDMVIKRLSQAAPRMTDEQAAKVAGILAGRSAVKVVG